MRKFGFIFLFSSLATASPIIQSHFFGPVRLNVWEHWQPSWNVDRDLNLPIDFELIRGFKEPTIPFVRLFYSGKMQSNLFAHLKATVLRPDGKYSDKEQTVSAVIPAASFYGRPVFELETSDFVDIPGKNLVTDISFEIKAGDQTLFYYRVTPMFVRGIHNHHWRTRIDPYMAHAGVGEIEVMNTLSAENKADYWDSVLVAPQISFMDRNFLAAQSAIGLHRHLRNQEMWKVNGGRVLVTHGIAPISGGEYWVDRKIKEGEVKPVRHIDAEGGYIEQRTLSSGEYHVIVPNPAHPQNVCVHGLRAMTDADIETIGTRN